MKKLLWLFLVCFLFIGVGSAKEYETETLKEACDIENLTCEHEDRVYDENLPNIYIFRGNGCPYCNRLLTFISSIADDYEVNISATSSKTSTSINAVTYKTLKKDGKVVSKEVISRDTYKRH